MAKYHIKVGTTLQDLAGSTLDDYVVEKITRRAAVDGTTRTTIAVRTVRQRCFPSTVPTVWSDTELLAQLTNGSLRVVETPQA
jgi:hypothetical protein